MAQAPFAARQKIGLPFESIQGNRCPVIFSGSNAQIENRSQDAAEIFFSFFQSEYPRFRFKY